VVSPRQGGASEQNASQVDVPSPATAVGRRVSSRRQDTSTAKGSCGGDRRPAGPTKVFARLYNASGLSNIITLETKAFTSRTCVKPQALAMHQNPRSYSWHNRAHDNSAGTAPIALHNPARRRAGTSPPAPSVPWLQHAGAFAQDDAAHRRRQFVEHENARHYVETSVWGRDRFRVADEEIDPRPSAVSHQNPPPLAPSPGGAFFALLAADALASPPACAGTADVN
jgi:hypothetical protein